jgi:iron(III) transport system permease protein
MTAAAHARLAVPAARRFDPWLLLVIAGAVPVALPVIVVLGFLAAPFGDVWRHLADTVLLRYVVNTVWLLLGVGASVLVTGVATAWLVTMCAFPLRRLFEWALMLPLAVPGYILAYTYTGLLDVAGPVQSSLRDWGVLAPGAWFPPIRSLGGAIAMLGLVLYPYVYLLARASFLQQSVAALEVSRTLGRGAWHSFVHVGLPLARPGIAAGLALALMEVLNDFGTVQYFAVDTFTTGIYRAWLAMGSPAAAAQLSAALMAFAVALVILERASRGEASFHHTGARYQRLPGYRLRGWRAAGAVFVCAMPVLIGFAIPGATLVRWAAGSADEVLDTRLFGYAMNSLILATASAGLITAVAVAVAYALRLRPRPWAIAAARLATMGYAVPGSVIAVGVLLPFAWFDNALDRWMRETFDVSTGLLLSGTIAAVLFAYLARFFAVAFNGVEAGLAKITVGMDAAARTLGLGPGRTLLRVHLPMLWSSVLTAGMIVFVDVMKELPATLIIRPFNFDTLAIRAFAMASDEQLRAAAVPSLAIVIAGILPVILISRGIAKGRPGHGAERDA